MSTVATAQDRLQALNQEIVSFQSLLPTLTTDRTRIARQMKRTAWKIRYLHIASWIRSPSVNDDFWRIGIIVVASLASGASAFVISDLIFGSVPFAFFSGILGAAIVAATVVTLFRYPSDELLPMVLVSARGQRDEVVHQLQVVTEQLASANRRLHSLIIEQNEILGSVELVRESLLSRDWKSMRGDAWENYLVEVFYALGAQAERIGGSGDQGVDIIVHIGQRRIAVQAKGYDELRAVNNKAVQEAYTGMTHHSCQGCVVITNTRFRRSARDLAASTGCLLIGAKEFRDFVLGRRPL